LVPGTLFADAITPDADVTLSVAAHLDTARQRLATMSESAMPEIQAWRRAFAAQGLKPTQYRCASESLLRRLRQTGDLPSLHPLVDLCNAVSVAFAIPIAAIDLDRIAGDLTVRYATGTETYETFGGEVEHPDPREVVFADGDGFAHARRWTNRQSGRSAIRPDTRRVLIVAEALHDEAAADMPKLLDALAEGLRTAWTIDPQPRILTADHPTASNAHRPVNGT
jgi:DNA/RNA-binding domain of Phe-tRNA-synthetase-like protein